MRSGRLVGAVVMVLIALAGYYGYREVNPITGEKQHIAMSQEQEVAMGLQAAPEMAQQMGGLHSDPQLQGLVRNIGNQLVQQSVVRSSPYQFSFNLLKDQETINA